MANKDKYTLTIKNTTNNDSSIIMFGVNPTPPKEKILVITCFIKK